MKVRVGGATLYPVNIVVGVVAGAYIGATLPLIGGLIFGFSALAAALALHLFTRRNAA